MDTSRHGGPERRAPILVAAVGHMPLHGYQVRRARAAGGEHVQDQ